MTKRYKSWLPWLMAFTDAVIIGLSFGIAYWIRYRLQWFRAVDPAYDAPLSRYVPLAIVLIVVLLLSYRGGGLYDLRRSRSWIDEMRVIINGTAIGIVTLVFFVFAFRPLVYSRLIFFYAAILIAVLLGISRMVKAAILASLRRRGRAVDRVVIVGAGETGRTVMSTLVANPELGYQVVGFVDDHPEKASTDIGRFQALGPVDNLPRVLEDQLIDQVIIALPWQAHRKIVRLVSECQRAEVRASIIPDMFQLSLSQVGVEDINGIPLIGMREVSLSGFNLALKRVTDVILSALMLIVGSPLLLLVALAIRLDFQRTEYCIARIGSADPDGCSGWSSSAL